MIADMVPSIMELGRLEATQVTIEWACQALEAIGEDLADRNLRLLIFEKFPHEIYDQIELRAEMFEDGDIHDLSFIRESLKIIVHRKMRSEEFGAKKVQELEPGISTMFASARNQGQSGQQGHPGQGPYTAARQPCGLRRKDCSYCDRPQYSD